MSDPVRERITSYVERFAPLRSPVLEIGSCQEPGRADVQDFRRFGDGGPWLGTDMRDGPGVDRVMNAEDLEIDTESMNTVLCAEMLEHARHPDAVLAEARRVLKPGGRIVVTTLFAFPEHHHPCDYWRFTTHGLRALLEDVGFRGVNTEYDAPVYVRLPNNTRPIPMHTFATAIK